MKNLELNLKKWLLIVERPKNYSLVHFKYGDTRLGFVNLDKANPYDDVIDFTIGKHLHTICSGSDLNEEIAAGMVEQTIEIKTGKTKYVHYLFNARCNTALESFISAIEAQGWYWGDNPLGDQPHNTGLTGQYPTGHCLMDLSLKKALDWMDAESRTFHPERVLIFEIVQG